MDYGSDVERYVSHFDAIDKEEEHELSRFAACDFVNTYAPSTTTTTMNPLQIRKIFALYIRSYFYSYWTLFQMYFQCNL